MSVSSILALTGEHRLRTSMAELEREEASEEWPALAEHLWMLAHRAIAHDLEDTSAALERMATADYLEEWEYNAMKTWWGRVTENIVLHHAQEEDLLFPFLRTRIDIPVKISDDHAELLTLMARTASAFDELGRSTTPLELLELVDEIEALMLPHMREEEVVVLPAMMRAFKPRDIRNIEKKMIKGFSPMDAPHFYRPFGRDIEKKRAHFMRSQSKPGFVFDMFVHKDFELYDEQYGWIIDALKDPSIKPWLDEQIVLRHAEKPGVMCTPGHHSMASVVPDASVGRGDAVAVNSAGPLRRRSTGSMSSYTGSLGSITGHRFRGSLSWHQRGQQGVVAQAVG